jgi:hypothetical protein
MRFREAVKSVGNSRAAVDDELGKKCASGYGVRRARP